MPNFQIVQKIFCKSKKNDQTNLDGGTSNGTHEASIKRFTKSNGTHEASIKRFTKSNGTHEASIKRFTKFIRDLRDLIDHVDYVGLDLIMLVF